MTFLRTTLPEIALGKTFLMDKNEVFFEDCQMQTIYFEGRKLVIIKFTIFYLMRITEFMGVWADVRKASLFIVHKWKYSSVVTQKTGPFLTTTQLKSWVKSKLLIKLIRSIFPLVYISVGKFIVWYNCRYHT